MTDDTDEPRKKTGGRPQAAKGVVRVGTRVRSSGAASAAAAVSERKRRATVGKISAAVGRREGSVAAAKTLAGGSKAGATPTPLSGKTDRPEESGKIKTPKLVRDSFTMPKAEYAVIATLKERCLRAGVSTKKSQILRAAVATLAKLSDAALAGAIQRLDVIKTGRPKKAK